MIDIKWSQVYLADNMNFHHLLMCKHQLFWFYASSNKFYLYHLFNRGLRLKSDIVGGLIHSSGNSFGFDISISTFSNIYKLPYKNK